MVRASFRECGCVRQVRNASRNAGCAHPQRAGRGQIDKARATPGEVLSARRFHTLERMSRVPLPDPKAKPFVAEEGEARVVHVER